MFLDDVNWKIIIPSAEEPVVDTTVGTGYHAPKVGTEEVPVVKKRHFRGKSTDYPSSVRTK